MFFICLLLSIIIVSKVEIKLFYPLCCAIFIVLLIHVLFTLDFTLGNISYFVSDELAYISHGANSHLSEQGNTDRKLWVVLNSIMQWPFYTDGLFNKLVPLVFLPFLMLVIYRIANNVRVAKYFVFIFPYTLFLSQINLRDILIYVVALYALYIFFSFKNKYKYFLISALLIMLVFLRPFLIPIVIMSIMVTQFIFNQSAVEKRLYLLLKIGLIVIVLSLLGYMLLASRIEQYMRYLTFILENGVNARGSEERIELGIGYILMSIVKFYTTPLPGSIIARALTDYSNQFGYLDDVFRFLSQLSLYISTIYLVYLTILKKNKWSRLLAKKNRAAISVIIYLSLNSLLYAMYYGGGGHSRLKIGVYLTIFLLILIMKSDERRIK